MIVKKINGLAVTSNVLTYPNWVLNSGSNERQEAVREDRILGLKIPLRGTASGTCNGIVPKITISYHFIP